MFCLILCETDAKVVKSIENGKFFPAFVAKSFCFYWQSMAFAAQKYGI
jgi:hypothetical protein